MQQTGTLLSGMTRSELVAWGAFLFVMTPLFMAAMGIQIPPWPWQRPRWPFGE